jgi:hypothetical protein
MLLIIRMIAIGNRKLRHPNMKLDIEDILHDQNDINESTRMQLENITIALSELQAKEPKAKPRRRIGFIQNDD